MGDIVPLETEERQFTNLPKYKTKIPKLHKYIYINIYRNDV